MVNSALISYRGVWEDGRRNWLWKREALEGLRSELERFSPWVGSMSCWALWTMLDRLENMVSRTLKDAYRCYERGDGTSPRDRRETAGRLMAE